MSIGAVAMAVATAGLVVGAGGAQAVEVEEPAVITRRAYFTRPASEAIPPVLLNGFPPSTVCLVAGLVGIPQVCGEAIRDIFDTIGVGDGLPVPVTPDADLVQLVLPGTTPVGMLGGQERYASLLQLQLPALPPEEELTSFELILHQTGINFAFESPAFRQAVLAAILQAEDPDPALFATLLEDVASGHTAVIAQTVTGIEACPVTEAWNEGDAQNAGLDGTRLPDADCILGTTGAFDPGTATWTFDLTFAAQAWTSGGIGGDVLPNNGIILRPVGAPNVAYGDPDLSTNFQISLADGETPGALAPLVRYATVPAFAPGTLAPPAPAPAASPPVARPPASAPATPSLNLPAAPAAAPAATGPGTLSARWGEPIAAGSPETPAWLWLMLPLGLAGVFLFGESLMAAPAAMIRHRPGAMSRLMMARGVTEESQ